VDAVLLEVQPQVEEWKEIRDVVPLEAVVTLSPSPPGQDVQIRNDQWKVLTTVGTSGHSVKAVLDVIGGDHIVGLRTLRDLQLAGLIVVERATDGSGAPEQRSSAGATDEQPPDSASRPDSPPVTSSDVPPADEFGDAPPPPPIDLVAVTLEDRFTPLAEVTIMPPPIVGDPWTPTADAAAGVLKTSENGVA
jgi:hypothetical protein